MAFVMHRYLPSLNLGQRPLAKLTCLGVGLVGAKYGYDFGTVIGGLVVGLMAGANTAVFGWLLTEALFDGIGALARRLRRPG